MIPKFRESKRRMDMQDKSLESMPMYHREKSKMQEYIRRRKEEKQEMVEKDKKEYLKAREKL